MWNSFHTILSLSISLFAYTQRGLTKFTQQSSQSCRLEGSPAMCTIQTYTATAKTTFWSECSTAEITLLCLSRKWTFIDKCLLRLGHLMRLKLKLLLHTVMTLVRKGLSKACLLVYVDALCNGNVHIINGILGYACFGKINVIHRGYV